MRKILIRFCDFLEKKLYAEPTYAELTRLLDTAHYKLEEAEAEIVYLKSLIKKN